MTTLALARWSEGAKVEHGTRHDLDAAAAVFMGEGEMVERCRALDWSATPLGPVTGWPPTLRAVVRACLASPFAISLWCGPELVLIYNDAYCRMLGAKHPAALGQPGVVVWAEIWPGIATLFERLRAGGPAAYAEDERFTVQRAPGQQGAGEERADAWFTFGLSAVRDEAGEIVAFLNIVSETTQRVGAEREAERLLRELEVERSRLEYVFRQAPTFLAVLRGPAHVFTFVNDAYCQVVGHRELVGRPVHDALPEVAEQGFVTLLDRVLETGEPYVGREVAVQLQRTQGARIEERFVDFVYLPVVEADGTRSGVIAHGSDVTEQVLARREVERLLGASERARAEADAANRAKSEFLATMSHEFRTPLNAIVGYAQLLDMGVLGPATPAQQAHLERLQASARHLMQLVDDVLDVAKVDADRLDVRRDTLATGAAVASALALILPQATSKGVRVLDLGAHPSGVAYVGDEHRVRQILVNLLSNAVKFTPAGGEVRITCGMTTDPAPGARLGAIASASPTKPDGASEATRPDPGGAWAFVRITDTGPGLAPELLGELFEPFVQGDSALTREQGGTGLGLAISRRLARLMGGDLTVTSTPGDGATFTLWLPAAPHPLPDRPAGSASAARVSMRTPVGAPAIAAPDAAAHELSGSEHRLDDAAFTVLHALGVRLAAEAEVVAERYVAALRADTRFPGVRDLPTVQLRDHATLAVGLLATQLMVIGETRGQAPELLGDGGQVQRFMDELHGGQRHRLGWSEVDIEREFPLLRAEVERALQSAVETATTAGAPEISTEAVRTATRYAIDVVRHVLDRGLRTSLRAHRFAKAAASP